MAKDKETEAPNNLDLIADLPMFDRLTINGVEYIRVPGGYLAVIGNTSAVIPLSDVAMAELGLEMLEGWQEELRNLILEAQPMIKKAIANAVKNPQ